MTIDQTPSAPPASTTERMAAWLAQDLFDVIPEGVPALDPEDDDESDDDQAYATCTQTFAPDGFKTDTSVGFFLLPENDEDLPGTDQPKHATLVYLGHTDSDGAPGLGDQRRRLILVASDVARDYSRATVPVVAVDHLGDDGAVCWMLDVEHPVWGIVNDLRETDSGIGDLYERGTFTKYPEFTPHVTVGYDPAESEVEQALDVPSITFDRLAVWFGDEHVEFPLGGED